MINRKKKLRIAQFSLLILGVLIIFLTYSKKENLETTRIIPEELQQKIKDQISNEESGDIFYNIEYSGLDLVGNRYILRSNEAFNDKLNQEVVYMKGVEAQFYFKDNTLLEVMSEEGVYNNQTLDMNFYKNVKAKYEGTELFAQKAEYSNSESFLIISDSVRVKDFRGTMVADNLFFDIKKQTLNISTIDDKKINANVNLK